MKKVIYILLSAVACIALPSCYEDYVKDYDYSTIYSAYQYDLRTFVVDEGAKFDFTVGLAGVLSNDKDRNVVVEIDDKFVSEDIPGLLGLVGTESFTSYNGMMGKAPIGKLSQSYVTEEVTACGIKSLTPLPADCYSIEGLNKMCIKEGTHTATVTVKATDKFFEDSKGLTPYYAIGFHILSADADKLPVDKSFEVIAVKYECKYFGNWYHGGSSKIVDNTTGAVISEDKYPMVIPQEDSKVYKLSTTGPRSVKTNKIGDKEGTMYLSFNEKGEITLTAPGKEITPGYCYSNNAKCIQDRVLHLNYSFDNLDGTSTVVADSLVFRNRVRDGISEWQDENPENYKE